MKLVALALAAACVAGHPFGLEFEDDVFDETFGHHGAPAKYGRALDAHPLPGKPVSRIVMDPLEDLMKSLGVLAASDDDEDLEEDMAMLAIMDSTPDMCPLCAKEGHALGHDAHKKVLAGLRARMVAEAAGPSRQAACPLCKAEGHTRGHAAHEVLLKVGQAAACPLCRAEGHAHNHGSHEALLALAEAMAVELPSKPKDFGCRLCNAEGSAKHHRKHEKLAADLGKSALELHQRNYEEGLSTMMALASGQEAGSIAARAEKQYAQDRQRMYMDEPRVVEFIFDWDMPTFMDMPAGEMLASRRAEPRRDLHRRAGEPADDLDDTDDEDADEKESLWEYILRNLKDMLGMSGAASSAGSGLMDFFTTFAMVLVAFTGCMLLGLGVLEIRDAVWGTAGDKGAAGYRSLAADERMMLDMEEGMAERGSIAL